MLLSQVRDGQQHRMALTPELTLTTLLQSRRQPSSAHKRKGWHAVQHNPSDGHNSASGKYPAAVYVRPDHSVSTSISLDDSPSFPSLGSFSAALPNQQTADYAANSNPNQQKSWGSPTQKQGTQQINSTQSPARPKYAAAASPARQKQNRSPPSDGIALSDAELTSLTMLLSTHPWAEPGLARVKLSFMDAACAKCLSTLQHVHTKIRTHKSFCS